MTRTDKDMDLLSAYIDGELEAPEAAQLAQRIAADETVARQAAKMAEMKSAVAALAQDVIVVTVPARPSPWRPFLGTGLAAGLALVAIAALWLGTASDQMDDAFRQAAEQHDLWTRDAVTAAVAPASAPDGLFAPELAAAGLTLTLLRDDVVIGGNRAVQAGYFGPHGCHLSLFRFAASADARPEFQLSSDSITQRASWSADSKEYLLVSRGMNEARFALIAGTLRSASLGNSQRDLGTIASLDTMHQPCAG